MPVGPQVKVTVLVILSFAIPFKYLVPVAVAVALFPDLPPVILDTFQLESKEAADGVDAVHLAVPSP